MVETRAKIDQSDGISFWAWIRNSVPIQFFGKRKTWDTHTHTHTLNLHMSVANVKLCAGHTLFAQMVCGHSLPYPRTPHTFVVCAQAHYLCTMASHAVEYYNDDIRTGLVQISICSVLPATTATATISSVSCTKAQSHAQPFRCWLAGPCGNQGV